MNDFSKNIIKSFLAYCQQRNLARQTITGYRYSLSKFSRFLNDIGIDRLENLTDESMSRYVISLSRIGLCPFTINRDLSVVRNLLTYAFNEKLIDRDVSVFVCNSLRAERRLPEYMTEYEVLRLLESANRKNNYQNDKYAIYRKLDGKLYMRDRAVLELMYASGCRSGEILKLEKNSLNFDEKQFRIMGKNGHERIAFFGSHAEGWIRLYLEHVRPVLVISTKRQSDNALFLNLRGGPLRYDQVNNIFMRYKRIAGIGRKLSPHSIRHSFATHLLNAETPIEIVQELMGHLAIDSSVRYTHIATKRLSREHSKYHPKEVNNMNQISYHVNSESELQRTNVMLSKKQTEALDKIARDLGMSRSSFIREAIAEKIARMKADLNA